MVRAAWLAWLAVRCGGLSLRAVHREVRVDGRAILAKVTYDEDLAAAPLVVFLSGADVPHERYAWLAERLASRGYACCLSSCVEAFGETTL